MADDELNQLQEWITESVTASLAAGDTDADAIVADTVDRWSTERLRRQWVRAVAWRAVTAAPVEDPAAGDADGPGGTDRDRLGAALRELDRTGIVARERLGLTLSDGWSLIREAAGETSEGCVFYHEQDRLTAAASGELMLAFGTLGERTDAEIGARVAETLRRHELTVGWDGDPGVRIRVALRRSGRRPAAATPPPGADFWPPEPGPRVGWAGRAERKEATVDWLRARHAAGEIVCANADARCDPAAPAGGFFHGYLTSAAIMAERGIDDRQLAALAATRNLGPADWDQESEWLCGVPATLVHTLNRLFAALPAEERADFVVAAVGAVPVGADLARVGDRWMLDLLADPGHGVLRHEGADARRAATEAVAAGLRRRLAGDAPAEAEWRATRDEAYSAGAYAAFFAAQGGAGDVAAEVVRVAGADAVPARRWQAGRLVHHLATAS
jgi:hypothetical protein